ncbi:MAG: hypothetical protein HY209_03270 [Candidatus Omnitrophica bacterium]|nr:hypothetical protein [Candidatus Omnitrophota bacterium]
MKTTWFFLLIGTIFLASFALNCGFLEIFVWNRYFEIVDRWTYVILAIVVGWQGFKFLRQWFLLFKGHAIKPESQVQRKFLFLTLGFGIVLMGSILSLMATLWPVNYYISIFSLYLLMPGQGLAMALLIGIYTLMSWWVVYVAAGVVSLETINPRLFKIVGAAILLSASLSVINLFL